MAVTAEDLRAQHEAAYENETGSLKSLLRGIQRLAHSYLLLAVLDMRRASVQLAWLIASGVLIAVLAVTAWLGVVTALAGWLLIQNMFWPAVLLIAAGLNAALALFLFFRMKRLLSEMPFAATLRQLKGDPPSSPESLQ